MQGLGTKPLYNQTNMDNIFVWKNYFEWKGILKDLSYGLLSDELIKKIQHYKKEIYTDDCGPLEKEIILDDNYVINYDKFIKGFKKKYKYILTFHASRPVQNKSYYENGIQKVSAIELNKKFRSLFLNDDHPEVTKQHIQDAINKMSNFHFPNGLYVSLDDREFLKYSGHYLIYGSEYITGLAANLDTNKPIDYRKYLRSIGKPTIFIIKLPIGMVDDVYLRCLYSSLIRSWIFNYANKRKKKF